MLIALGFEFVNGFHGTANAVATVVYAHSLPPQAAAVWSGCFNCLGVLTSSGAVAFGIASLLPVELIPQVGSGAGYAMVFALPIAATIWNLGTWPLGLPASSSRILIGSVVGVGLASQLLAPQGTGASGVDWTQALGVFKALLFSPLVGFACAGLLLAMKAAVRSRHGAPRAGGGGAERAQRHVPGRRGDPAAGTPEGIFRVRRGGRPAAWRGELDKATKYIPAWVKVAVAIALGLGTMAGWKRIVATVGERVGKTHLAYAQGASAELVAAVTIGAADLCGLPVSTARVLSSGVAGAMAANGSGLQWATVRGIAMAWVLTLPAAVLLSGSLYALFRQVFRKAAARRARTVLYQVRSKDGGRDRGGAIPLNLSVRPRPDRGQPRRGCRQGRTGTRRSRRGGSRAAGQASRRSSSGAYRCTQRYNGTTACGLP